MTRAVPTSKTSKTSKTPDVLRVSEYNLLSLRSWWVTAVITGVVTPLVFALALGVGLGKLVDAGSGSLGVPYLDYVAPGLLAATALQLGTADATFPVMQGFKWQRVFHGIAATPITTRQLADGTLVWITIRLVANSAVFLAVIALLGGTERWWVVLAIPAATLTGVAFAAPITAVSASVYSDGQAFNVIFRFVVIPMFLFSGTFYPVSRLPDWAEWLAYVTPLWHGTELCRGAALGGLSGWVTLGHVAYLLAWVVVGTGLARWRFRVRIEK